MIFNGPLPPAAPATESDTLRARQRAFCDAFAICGNVSKAAELAGIHRATHYGWLEDDPEYAIAFQKADEDFRDRIRDFVRRRAIDGVPEPIIWQGTIIRDDETQEIVTVLKRSDRILEMLAQAKCPEFRDKHEVSGPNGEPIKTQTTVRVEFVRSNRNNPDSGSV